MIPITDARASLIKPLNDRAILVKSEEVYYAERQHWASIVQPIFESMQVLLALITVADLRSGSWSRATYIILVFLAIGILYGISLVMSGGPLRSQLAVDPFATVDQEAGRIVVIGVAVAILASALFTWIGYFVILYVVTRLSVILSRWTFYERRFLTNRRLIESGGFLGSRISSMPHSRVTDISYSRTVPGELLGYATMRVETAGQDQALGLVQYIANPSHFYEVIVDFSAPETMPVVEGIATPRPPEHDD